VRVIRVFIAQSLDGFIAGPDDDLSWLPQGDAEAQGVFEDSGYAELMEQSGALLMGRRTFDVVHGFGSWPYGDMPVFVATSRPLGCDEPTVRAVAGTPHEMLGAVRDEVGDGGIYLDGGALIRSFLDVGLVDEVTVTVIPVILGEGVPLFAGTVGRRALRLQASRELGAGVVQLRYSLSGSG
jgi:dihydrofolate reductase